MINPETFVDRLEELCQTFGRQLDDRTRDTWHRLLSQRLDTQAFSDACDQALLECQTFPTPAKLLEIHQARHPSNPAYQQILATQADNDFDSPQAQAQRRQAIDQLRQQLSRSLPSLSPKRNSRATALQSLVDSFNRQLNDPATTQANLLELERSQELSAAITYSRNPDGTIAEFYPIPF